MLYSIGKDSSVLVRLAQKAFHPAPLPFPLLHIDTTWKFRDMIAFRDRFAQRTGSSCIVHTNRDGRRARTSTRSTTAARSTRTVMKTQALLQALARARLRRGLRRRAPRRGEVARQGARLLVPRSLPASGIPKNQRPELWNLYNGKIKQGREHPRLPALQLDRARRLAVHLPREDPDRAALLRGAAPGGRARRHAHHGRRRAHAARAGRDAARARASASARSAATRSPARSRATRDDAARDHPRDAARRAVSERQGRLIDHDEDASMENEEARGVLLMATRRAASIEPIERRHRRATSQRHEHKELLRFVDRRLGRRRQVDAHRAAAARHARRLRRPARRGAKRASTHGGRRRSTSRSSPTASRPSASRASPSTSPIATSPPSKRKFIIADTPGHVQYTRNMVDRRLDRRRRRSSSSTRASACSQQSRRHAYIASLLGIPHLLVCVNKMDLAATTQASSTRIRAEFAASPTSLALQGRHLRPVSALARRQRVTRSARHALVRRARRCSASSRRCRSPRIATSSDFRFPVQYVLRPNLDYRGFAGADRVRRGARRATPSWCCRRARRSRVKAHRHLRRRARRGVRARERDLAPRRRDRRSAAATCSCTPSNRPRVQRSFDAHVVWMHERAARSAEDATSSSTRRSMVRMQVDARALDSVDLATLQPSAPPRRSALNDIGARHAHLPPAALLRRLRATTAPPASFIIIDSLTNDTVGAGMILDDAAGAAGSRRRARARCAPGADAAGRTQVSAARARRKARAGRRSRCCCMARGRGAAARARLRARAAALRPRPRAARALRRRRARRRRSPRRARLHRRRPGHTVRQRRQSRGRRRRAPRARSARRASATPPSPTPPTGRSTAPWSASSASSSADRRFCGTWRGPSVLPTHEPSRSVVGVRAGVLLFRAAGRVRRRGNPLAPRRRHRRHDNAEGRRAAQAEGGRGRRQQHRPGARRGRRLRRRDAGGRSEGQRRPRWRAFSAWPSPSPTPRASSPSTFAPSTSHATAPRTGRPIGHTRCSTWPGPTTPGRSCARRGRACSSPPSRRFPTRPIGFTCASEITKRNVSVWVDGGKKPCLVVERFVVRERGAVGLWVDSKEGAFRNLKISPAGRR